MYQFVDEIYTFVKTNSVISFLITTFFALTLWLYKESKTSHQTKLKRTVEELTRQLQIYGRLESLLALHIRLDSHETAMKLYETIGDSAPYVSERVRTVIKDIHRYFEPTKLVFLQSLIQTEISELLKRLRECKVDFASISLESFIKRLVIPARPLALLAVIVLLIAISTVRFVEVDTFFLRISVVASAYALLVGGAAFIVVAGELIKRADFRRPRSFFIYTLLISMSPLITIFKLETACFVLALQIGGILYFTKRTEKSSLEVVTS